MVRITVTQDDKIFTFLGDNDKIYLPDRMPECDGLLLNYMVGGVNYSETIDLFPENIIPCSPFISGQDYYNEYINVKYNDINRAPDDPSDGHITITLIRDGKIDITSKPGYGISIDDDDDDAPWDGLYISWNYKYSTYIDRTHSSGPYGPLEFQKNGMTYLTWRHSTIYLLLNKQVLGSITDASGIFYGNILCGLEPFLPDHFIEGLAICIAQPVDYNGCVIERMSNLLPMDYSAYCMTRQIILGTKESDPYYLAPIDYDPICVDLVLANSTNIYKNQHDNKMKDDTKNHLIHPVFFRVHPLANIVVHPEVTEKICINLDNYKSQVDIFYLQLGGCSFPEIGRTPSGVIFKIEGSLLGNIGDGTYYILNQDNELVTTGKYTVER